MKQEIILELRINQLVKVKCNEPIKGFYIAKVKSLNDWEKLIGVVDCHERYKEVPPRLILSCL